MRVLAIGLAIAVIVFVVSGGHVLFLPLLFIPLGLFSLGDRRRQQPSSFRRDRLSGPSGKPQVKRPTRDRTLQPAPTFDLAREGNAVVACFPSRGG
jgi:hypothetical protein